MQTRRKLAEEVSSRPKLSIRDKLFHLAVSEKIILQ